MVHFRWILLLCVSSIFIMGLIMIFNTTSAEILDHALEKNTHQALFKQIIYGCLGLMLAGAIYKMGYEKFLALSPYFFVILCFLLVLTLIPGIGKEVNGSKRWIGIGTLSFQPSEYVKYIVPAYLIHRLLPIDPSKISFVDFCKLAGISGIPIFLILIEPNNGTAGVIGLSTLVVWFLARVPCRYWTIPLFLSLLVAGISIYHLPYVSARINVYLHPELDLLGKGHQPYQAKIAAGSGQIFGRGPGKSLQKLSYLPEAQNDYIAAIFAEEFGFVGVCCLILLYMFIGYVGFMIAHTSRDLGGFYLASIITFLICFQSFMNLGVVSGLLPSTGLNLPFFSQGGTSLMTNFMGIGLLLNVGEKKCPTQVMY